MEPYDMSRRYYGSSRHELFRVPTALEANRRDKQMCRNALKKMSEDEQAVIRECVMELTENIRNLGVNSALCLIGAMGRYFVEHPDEFEARINATKV